MIWYGNGFRTALLYTPTCEPSTNVCVCVAWESALCFQLQCTIYVDFGSHHFGVRMCVMKILSKGNNRNTNPKQAINFHANQFQYLCENKVNQTTGTHLLAYAPCFWMFYQKHFIYACIGMHFFLFGNFGYHWSVINYLNINFIRSKGRKRSLFRWKENNRREVKREVNAFNRFIYGWRNEQLNTKKCLAIDPEWDTLDTWKW